MNKKRRNFNHKPIRVEKISSRKFRLCEDVNIFGVDVPKGYITNGSSVPRIFWFVLSPFTEGFRAAIVHDYRYKTHEITRKEADREFYYNLKECGVNITRRTLAYYTIRMFGFLFWDKYT